MEWSSVKLSRLKICSFPLVAYCKLFAGGSPSFRGEGKGCITGLFQVPCGRHQSFNFHMVGGDPVNGKCVPVVHFSLVEASPILFPVVAAHLPFLQGPCYLFCICAFM